MVKFPSQNKLQYVTGAIANDAWTIPTSGGTTGALNLPKDLSILNRRSYASTDRRGVPWVFRVKFDLYLQDEDGFGLASAVGTDFMTTLKIDGCQNNWVMRNAAVKWHAAREKMFSRAGITRKQRGAYAHEIRYQYDAAAQTWLTPIDGAGDAFTGGTWDTSMMITAADADIDLKLVGVGQDEESDASSTALQIGHSYLLSRQQPHSDSNVEASETPADLSVLRSLLADAEPSGSRIDDINAEARDAQDNPPYELIDISDSGDVHHDITEQVELGRAVAGLGNSFGSVVVDIPFGLAKLRLTHYDAADTNVTDGALINAEVLSIYPMQG